MEKEKVSWAYADEKKQIIVDVRGIRGNREELEKVLIKRVEKNYGITESMGNIKVYFREEKFKNMPSSFSAVVIIISSTINSNVLQ